MTYTQRFGLASLVAVPALLLFMSFAFVASASTDHNQGWVHIQVGGNTWSDNWDTNTLQVKWEACRMWDSGQGNADWKTRHFNNHDWNWWNEKCKDWNTWQHSNDWNAGRQSISWEDCNRDWNKDWNRDEKKETWNHDDKDEWSHNSDREWNKDWNDDEWDDDKDWNKSASNWYDDDWDKDWEDNDWKHNHDNW